MKRKDKFEEKQFYQANIICGTKHSLNNMLYNANILWMILRLHTLEVSFWLHLPLSTCTCNRARVNIYVHFVAHYLIEPIFNFMFLSSC